MFLVGAAFFALSANTLSAQSIFAMLTGVVSDPSEASVVQVCIPTMSITQSDLMSISYEHCDAGLSQSGTVIGMSQEHLPINAQFLLFDSQIGTLTVLAGVAPGGYPGLMRRTGSEAMAE